MFCIWKASDLQIQNVSRTVEGKIVAQVLDTIFKSKNYILKLETCYTFQLNANVKDFHLKNFNFNFLANFYSFIQEINIISSS